MEVKGNLHVRQDLTVDRRINADRVDSGLDLVGGAGVQVIDINSASWVRVTDAATTGIKLPDATTLPLGWSIKVKNEKGASLSILDNNDDPLESAGYYGSPISNGDAYEYTLMTKGTAAGTWHINFLEVAPIIPADRFISAFLIGGWTAQAITITAINHTKGLNPTVHVYENDGGILKNVILDDIEIAANGNVTLKVTAGAEFAGTVVIL